MHYVTHITIQNVRQMPVVVTEAWEAAAAAGKACQHETLTASYLFSVLSKVAVTLQPLVARLADTNNPSITSDLADAIPVLQAAADDPGSFTHHSVLSKVTLTSQGWQRVRSRAQQHAAAGRARYAARALADFNAQQGSERLPGYKLYRWAYYDVL
jgi:hypothetical protein